MAEIQIARIDYRLIHGQVITKWLKAYPAKRIIIVDDELAQDDFMAEIYTIAAPAGIKVDIVTVERAKEFLDSIKDRVFLLFKNVTSCFSAFQKGILFSNLIVGGVPTEAGKTFVYSGVYLNYAKYQQLDEIKQNNISVILQATPDDSFVKLEKIKEKL